MISVLKDLCQHHRKSNTRNFQEPTDSKYLRRFLRMINFYMKLIPQAADVLLPRTEAIKQNPAAKVLKLNPVEKEAFVAFKDILAKLSVLTHLHPDATPIVRTMQLVKHCSK